MAEKYIERELSGAIRAVFELLPLSYSEVRDVADGKPSDDLLFDGFHPAVWAGKNKPELLYPAYIKTYLDKDVRDLLLYIPEDIRSLNPVISVHSVVGYSHRGKVSIFF